MRPMTTLLLCLCTIQGFCQQQLHYTIYFQFDKDTLTTTALKQLAEIGTVLGIHGASTIKISGNTDKFGSNAYNEKLSYNRAVKVAKKIGGMLPADVAIDTSMVWQRQPAYHCQQW